MNSKKNQKVLKQIADKHGISLATANEIIVSQFHFLRKMINDAKPFEDDYPVISVKHLGKFLITKERRYVLNKLKLNDKLGYKILPAPDRVSGDSEEHTSEAIQGEGVAAG